MTWRRLLIVLILVTLFYDACGQSPVHSSRRELKLDCPADEFNTDSNEQERIEGRFDAYSRGSTGVELVGKLRPKPQSFYQNIVNQVIMFVCDVELAGERCVEEDSVFAAKDWAGQCIKAADHTCPTGMCERSSNCYWNSVNEGQNRTTRFPIEEYTRAESALVGESGDIALQFHSYAGGIATVGLIGAAVSLVLLFLWVVFFIGRYFCCCLWTQGFCFLCSPIPSKDGYRTFRDIILPVVFYIIATVAIAVATAIAFIGNEDIR
jgi:hypothetical protein